MSIPVRTATLLSAIALAGVTACANAPVEEPATDLGILWVRDAAEYRALALQAYGSATEDLRDKILDTSWSALPDQHDASGLQPAIILDVDETLVTNVHFQATLEPPFLDGKLNDWNAANEAVAVPGAADFVRLARQYGVAVYFVTNRPCEPQADVADPCPQQAVTVQDLNEAGIRANADEVLMAREQPGWTREKKVRRDLIAEDHRVIMLVGDDLGDFIPCVRARPVAPCTRPASRASRQELTDRHTAYWGNGWYLLPNPMHGSWTSVE